MYSQGQKFSEGIYKVNQEHNIEAAILSQGHSRICPTYFDGGKYKKKYRRQLPSIFPWSKPCEERKLPVKRGLDFNDILSETNLAATAESAKSEFEAVEVRVLEDNAETIEFAEFASIVTGV